MQEARRCGQCNTLNEQERRYCKNCGKYLKISTKKDRIITVWELDKTKETVCGSTCAAPHGGALPRGVAKDTSQMRLISLSSPDKLPSVMKEAGNILGKDPTVCKDIVSQHKIHIWHSPAGWYAKALAGVPLYNNVAMSTARQIKLSDGDVFMLDQEQLRVEII